MVVDQLKKKIKEEAKPTLDLVPATHLTLHRVTISASLRKEPRRNELNQLSKNLPEDTELEAYEPLSADIYNSPPEGKKYIILVRTPEGESIYCDAAAETVLTRPIYPPLIVYHSLQSLPFRLTSTSAVDLTQPSKSTEHGRAKRT